MTPFPLAMTHTAPTLLGIGLASVLIGVAVGGLAGALIAIVHRSRKQLELATDFDAPRRQRVAEADATYRLLRPLLMEMTTWRWLMQWTRPERIRRHLDTGVLAVPWQAEEYMATRAFDAGLATMVLTAGAVYYFGLQNGLIVGAIWLVWSLSRIEPSLAKKAAARTQEIDRRLPFAIDLMSLMMAAGATAYDSLAVMVRESSDHPLGEEFRRVHQSIERGASLEDALLELRERLRTDAVNELAVVVKLGVSQGTPLAESFLGLADQMRLRRSQWAERAAGKAQTMITFPAMVVMIACLVIIVAPFAITAVNG